MLSADHLFIKYNMAAQHDLGTGWHAAVCAAEPRRGSRPGHRPELSQRKRRRRRRRRRRRKRGVERGRGNKRRDTTAVVDGEIPPRAEGRR